MRPSLICARGRRRGDRPGWRRLVSAAGQLHYTFILVISWRLVAPETVREKSE